MKSVFAYKVGVSFLATTALYLFIALLEWSLNPMNWHLISRFVFLVLAGVWLWMISTSEMEDPGSPNA
ncbi:hypothetical protein [Tellurirhabdus bombi]|uniref:hypothetical protein n=1 Tax=Tellurirhabdus bombi TaxID=2907205 RepID=UPI001F170E2A|nr:hypothetical protein [Tellurirhabdus bombi]